MRIIVKVERDAESGMYRWVVPYLGASSPFVFTDDKAARKEGRAIVRDYKAGIVGDEDE